MAYQRIVIKLGTSTLTAGTDKFSYPHIIDLVRQTAHLHSKGSQVVIASSGAMAAGRESLDFPELPKFVPAKQMLAAIGQPRLMAIYNQLFSMYGVMVAQVLLTRTDLTDRRRYLNARNTLEALLAQQVIPIVNENDTVATEEIRVGDNDNLSAMVSNLIEADLLIMLTDQVGLFTSDPRQDTHAKFVEQVSGASIPEELWQNTGGSGKLGTGGMLTKLQAADLARRSGTTVVIAGGEDIPDILMRIAEGEQIGTRFLPLTSTLESRKRYMLAGRQKLDGKLAIDRGAARALKQGGSLLPVGIVNVNGKFERGDTIKLVDSDENELAIGLANYASSDLTKICGLQSKEIEMVLGYTYGDEVIHHNNMMLL